MTKVVFDKEEWYTVWPARPYDGLRSEEYADCYTCLVDVDEADMVAYETALAMFKATHKAFITKYAPQRLGSDE